MKKIAFLSFLLGSLAFGASSSEQDGLSIVVGSTRELLPLASPLMHAIIGQDTEDLKHLKTYDGKAVTVDINPCTIDGAPHLQVDASTYKFPPLSNVYLERYPTSFPEDGRVNENAIGIVLKNLSQYMLPTCKLEIEWDPYVVFCRPNKSDDLDTFLIPFVISNPFQGYVEMNTVLHGAWGAIAGKEPISQLEPCIRTHAEAFKKPFDELVDFYIDKGGLKREEICDRLFCEVVVMLELIRHPDLVLISQANSCSPFGELENSEKIFMPERYLPVYISKFGGIRAPTLYINTVESFIRDTSLKYLLSDLAATNQWPYVKEYLATIGFPDATLERKTSPHNGRKNVWIITGVKS